MTGLLGIAVILALGWTLSLERRSIRLRPVVTGVALQFTLAYLLLRFKPVVAAFDLFARGVTRVIAFADEGTAFVFGRAADASQAWGFIFAVKVLPSSSSSQRSCRCSITLASCSGWWRRWRG